MGLLRRRLKTQAFTSYVAHVRGRRRMRKSRRLHRSSLLEAGQVLARMRKPGQSPPAEPGTVVSHRTFRGNWMELTCLRPSKIASTAKVSPDQVCPHKASFKGLRDTNTLPSQTLRRARHSNPGQVRWCPLPPALEVPHSMVDMRGPLQQLAVVIQALHHISSNINTPITLLSNLLVATPVTSHNSKLSRVG